MTDHDPMPRRDRQRTEIAELCRTGALSRAIDLAITHVADFGPDEALVTLIGDAVARSAPPAPVRRRYAELACGFDGPSDDERR